MDSETVLAAPQESHAPPQSESHETRSETPVEERPGPESSTINLGDLSEEAYRKYQLGGKLPAEIEPKPAPKKPKNILEKLSKEELSHWQETSELPDRLAEETTSAAKEKTEPAAVGSKVEFVRLNDPAFERLTPEDCANAEKVFPERWRKAVEAHGDHEQFVLKHNPVLQNICNGNAVQRTNCLKFLDGLNPYMEHPYEAFREFLTNADFRGRIERGGEKVAFAVMREFDRNYKPPKRSRVPAPATSITGKSTAPVDEENAALSKGDAAAYFRAANAADIARSKGRR